MKQITTDKQRRHAPVISLMMCGCLALVTAVVFSQATAVTAEPSPRALEISRANARQDQTSDSARDAASSANEQTPPEKTQPERIARLIRDLGSDSFRTRESAQRRLSEIGRDSILPLESVKDSSNPELRQRATDLLYDLKKEAMWDGTAVSVNAVERPVAEVLAEVAQKSGNELALGGGNSGPNEHPVTAQYQRTLFWQVVDELCAQSGNHLARLAERSGMRLAISDGPPPVAPLAYSGPFRGQILSAQRAFSEELNHFTGEVARTHTFRLVVQIEWEEQFQLIGHQQSPQIVEAVTDTGDVLQLTTKPEAMWVAANPNSRKVVLKLELTPPPIAANKISMLRLGWDVAAVGDFAELRIDDLTLSKVYEDGDARVTVESRVVRPYQRQELQLRIDRIFPDWQPREMFYNETDVRMLDGEGTPLRLEKADWSSQATGLNVRARFLGATAGPPKSILVRYPRLRDRRMVELRFTEIPLPRGVPD